MLIFEAIERYRLDVVPSVADPRRRNQLLEHIRKHFARVNCEQVQRAHVNAYCEKRRRAGVGEGTIRLELNALVAVLNHAKRERFIRDVPHVHLPTPPPPRDRWLTRDEADRLREACAPRVRLFVEIALATGGRPQAIEALTWDRVDLASKVIDFHVHGESATKKRRPKVPMSDALFEVLQREHARVAGFCPAKRSPLVLGGEGAIYKGFAGACRRAGLKGVTPKTLRHTWATWAAQAGKNLWSVAGVLGDKLATVEARYAHHHPDYLRDAVAL